MVSKACHQCRSSKRRCDLVRDQQTCEPCARRSLKCSRSIKSSRSRTLQPAYQSPTPKQSLRLDDLDESVVDEVVGLYFRHIHDKPHTIFHEKTFRASIADKTAPEMNVLAVIGMAARFSSKPDVRALGDRCGLSARSLLKESLEDISLANVQGCILAGNLCGADGDYGGESLYFGLATCKAQLLHLEVEREGMNEIQRETERRVWWSLFMIDRWASAGMGLTPRFGLNCKHPIRPMDELAFQNLDVAQSRTPRTLYRYGLWSYMVSLVEIFVDIQQFNRTAAETNSGLDAEVGRAQQLIDRLDGYEARLPNDLQWSDENLAGYADNGAGATFVALHLGFHHYATLLYFQYLDTQSSNYSTDSHWAQRCKHHAAAFSDVLHASFQHKDSAAVYVIVAHMATVSSSVLLHTLLFGEEHELSPARVRLEHNFEALCTLQVYWPGVKGMMDRLALFHDFCFWSIDEHTHKVDRWMLKFLLQHASELQDKPPPISSPVENGRALRSSTRGMYTTRMLSGLLENQESMSHVAPR
ncbi:hypothetical protein BDZ85DRAFT_192868 [Elsinoe ampelina]|uniref:Zn(2)-C6 fungal-type domain-containing protein n=1 Tax=Elsinoe ampelina TaxID=302913 RepID=A0A6A6GKN2_9PEZI|nr:hypothetical protein BDZ85DRAFT_192868 [Elsinoe ampelina]